MKSDRRHNQMYISLTIPKYEGQWYMEIIIIYIIIIVATNVFVTHLLKIHLTYNNFY